jgi:hypothetical protein
MNPETGIEGGLSKGKTPAKSEFLFLLVGVVKNGLNLIHVKYVSLI